MNTTIPLLRNSERAALKKCPQSWYWRWDQGLVSRLAKTDARWFGTGVHLVLAEHYTPPKGITGKKRGFTRGRDMLETWEEFSKNAYTTISCGPYFDEVAEKEYYDAVELGKIMFTAYKKHYGDDEAWEVLMPETRFSTNIPYNKEQLNRIIPEGIFPKGQFITRIVGTFDMPIRDHTDGHVKVVDHKTTNKKESTAHLVKDDQAGTYISISTEYLRRAGFIHSSEAVVGMIYNYLRKGKPDERPTNELGQACNKPTKKHYVEQILPKMIGYTEQTLSKFTISQLEELAATLKLTVLGDVSLQQPNPLFWREDVRRNKYNRLRQIKRIADDAEIIANMRAGKIPVIKSPAEHCNWCDFKELCDVEEDGGDVGSFIEAMYEVQDPYADHREGAKNSKEAVATKKETNVR